VSHGDSAWLAGITRLSLALSSERHSRHSPAGPGVSAAPGRVECQRTFHLMQRLECQNAVRLGRARPLCRSRSESSACTAVQWRSLSNACTGYVSRMRRSQQIRTIGANRRSHRFAWSEQIKIEYERLVLVMDKELTWGTSAEKVGVDPTSQNQLVA
jgi:hypothetical protein